VQVRSNGHVVGAAGGREHDLGPDPITVLGAPRAGSLGQHGFLGCGEHDNEGTGDHHRVVVA
jgi:hypothetical protein